MAQVSPLLSLVVPHRPSECALPLIRQRSLLVSGKRCPHKSHRGDLSAAPVLAHIRVLLPEWLHHGRQVCRPVQFLAGLDYALCSSSG